VNAKNDSRDPRIAVVGAGGHATRCLYPNLGKAGAELVGVCDWDRERAATNARRFGGRVYTDVEEMLDREAPDGVMICIGPEQHAQLASLVLRRGLPVYTEKPPASTAADALRVARLAAKTGLLCTTAFKKRYNTAYDHARRWLEGFPPGSLSSVSMDYGSARYPNHSARDSFLLDFCIHGIDLIQYLAGDAESVFCFTRDGHDYAASLRFLNGAVGTLTFTDARSFSVPTEEVELSVAGGNWMTIHNSSVWRITEEGKPSAWREPPTFTSQGDSGNETGHFAEIADFLEAIREGRTTRSNSYESYRSMVLYEAIVESARTTAVVSVHYESL
jgi:predicted dehydrogenase